MIRTIDGVKYLMRDERSTSELRKLHMAFEDKYGQIDFHRWLAERGKVHVSLTKGQKPPTKIISPYRTAKRNPSPHIKN